MRIRHFLRNAALGALIAIGGASAAFAQVDEAARAALPDSMRSGGALRLATSLQWAPFDYKDDKDEAAGLDIDLIKMIAAKLGLKFEYEDVKFPSIITGVSSGRFHVGINQLSITPERLGAADMIPYFDTSSMVLIQKGKPVPDIRNLCGLTFVVTQGSVQVRQLNELSAACVAKNAKPVEQQLYPSSAETLLAVANGRGDAFLTAAPQGVYITKVNAKVQLVPGDVPGVTRTPAGIIVEKGNAPMRKAVALALLSLMQDGSYQTLLDRYGVGTGTVPADEVRKSAQ